MRVLSVDDKPENRYLVEVQLRSQGWEVVSAQNGAEALARLDREPFDAIVSDILMPEMDGFQLCKEVRARDRLRRLPFVFYTATYTDTKDEELALSLGASRFVAKPAEPEELARAIREAISEGSAVTGAPRPPPAPPPAEEVLLRSYNERLVQKLDRKVAQLELATRELRTTNLALEEARAGLEEAVTAGKVGLWDWTLATGKARYSREWKRQIGYGPDELSDELSEWQTRVHPEDRAHTLATVQRYLDGARPDFEAEFRFRHKDGSYRHIIARGREVRDERGARVRVVGSHVDITERAMLQAQLMQAQKMETVGRLAGGVAHDFNNLLTAIVGFSELAMSNLAAEDPIRQNLEQVLRASARATRLTRQLLVFSRREAVEVEVIDLNAQLAELRPMLARLIGEDIELVLEAEGGLGRVRADAGRLEQVVLNLCVNARDAMPRGGRLVLQTANVDLREPLPACRGTIPAGRWVMLAVRDTGCGMSPEVLAHIFEPFFTTKEAGKGTGLGLSTVFGIAQASGGYVAAQSEVGRGSTLQVYLPRVDEAPPASAEAPAAHRPRGTETVLLVEDDEQVLTIAEGVLRASGYQVHTAMRGEAARRLCAELAPRLDLLLTDLVLPDMSGQELAASVTRACPGARVLFTSGYPSGVPARDEALGAAAFLQKPFTTAELLARVRGVLDAPAAPG